MTNKIEVIPNSLSIILRATHILFIEVVECDAGEWTPVATGGVQCQSDLMVSLREVLKGETRGKSEAHFEVTITQYGTGTSRIAAVPGVWSNQITDPGAELVAYCVSEEDVAATMLTEPECRRVVLAERDLTDIRLALEAETGQLAFSEVLTSAENAAVSLGAVFSEYLWVRYRTAMLDQPEYYDSMIGFIKHQALTPVARATLLDALFSYISTVPNASDIQINQLARALFQLLDVPAASNLHDTIVDVFLPNLLGLVKGKETRPVDTFFARVPQKRQEAEKLLNSYRGQAATSELLSWLRAEKMSD